MTRAVCSINAAASLFAIVAVYLANADLIYLSMIGLAIMFASNVAGALKDGST